MSIVLTGGVGITTPDITSGSYNQGQLAGFRNKIINGAFQVNQRVVSGTVTLAAGDYGHDRWKAGSGGCTYTFSTVDNVTTITISAGTLVQIIEGLNLQSGLHVLSWQGTAQGRVDSGAYGNSGEVTSAVVGGVNTTIEFNAGTVTNVQFEPGEIATVFGRRDISTELARCQRYFRDTVETVSGVTSTSAAACAYGYPPMRAAPSFIWVSGGTVSDGVQGYAVTSATATDLNKGGCRANFTASGLTAGRGCVVLSPRVQFNAEL